MHLDSSLDADSSTELFVDGQRRVVQSVFAS